MNETIKQQSKKSQMNVKEADKQNSSETIERENIENTPFTLIKVEEKWFGAMGKYRITEPSASKKEIETELKKVTWNRIVQVIQILIENQK